MPRDSSGNYTLVPGNPVIPGTLIESTWANTTMDDIAANMTESLSRQGQGGMQAPLRLTDGSITSPSLSFNSDTNTGLYLENAEVRYSNGIVDGPIITDAPSDGNTYARQNASWLATDFGAYSPLAIGSVVAYSGSNAAIPTGWIECNGQAVSRTTYSDLNDLYAAAGYPYGDGDTTTTFNVPDLRGRSAVGVGTGTGLTARTLGQQFGAETHSLTLTEMPRHNHTYRASPTFSVPSGSGNAAHGNDDGVTSSVGGLQGQGSGNSVAHNNVQPSLGMVWVVKGLEDVVSGGPGAVDGHVIQDGGTTFPQRTNLKFLGTGVTVTDQDAGSGDASVVTIDAVGGGAGTYNNITDDTTTSTGRAQIRFTATGDASVSVADDAGNDRTNVIINATAGGVPRTLKIPGPGFGVSGAITDVMDIATLFVPVAATGQVVNMVSATGKLKVGTCDAAIRVNGGTVGTISLTTITGSITFGPISVTDNAEVTLLISNASVDAELLSLTCDLEHTI